MGFVAGIVFLIVIGVLLDMLRGKKPSFKLYHGQKLRSWDDEPKPKPKRQLPSEIGLPAALEEAAPKQHPMPRGHSIGPGTLLQPPAPPSPTATAPRPTTSARYRVLGVDRESKMDTEWFCEAASPENAKVKGELEGIIVTRVEQA